MIKIVIVDDDELVIESFKIILDYDEDFEVIGTAGNGEEAVALMKELEPDIVLMDIQMPKMNGIAAAEKIIQAHKKTRVIMLTTFHDYQNIHLSLKAGASGYLLKSDDTLKQKMTIKAVHSGLPIISEEALKGFREETSELLLTPRERDILELVANGFSNREISERLFLGEGTVRNTLSVILEKLELRDRTQLAIYYWQTKTGHTK